MRLSDLAARAVVTGLGTGYSPLAPGTCASLLALVLAWILNPLAWWFLPAAVLLSCMAGVPLSFWAERRWGADPPRVVIDELAGQWLALVLLPRSLVLYSLAFVIFRLFDIFKPWGIYRIQEASGGWGVMLDDLLAGFYTNIVLQIAALMFYRQASVIARFLGLP
jgi:phosphatidylglycerophosphatase A